MSTKIVLKYGSGDPSGNLNVAEPAFDIDNNVFYIGSSIEAQAIKFYNAEQVDSLVDTSTGYNFDQIAQLDASIIRIDASLGSGGGSGSTTLAALTDTSISSKVDNDFLQYNDDTSTWDNVSSLDISTLFKLSVDIDSSFALYQPEVNLDSSFGDVYTEIIRIDASLGIGVSSLEKLTDTAISSKIDNDFLQYDDDTSTWINVFGLNASTYFTLSTDVDAYNIIQDTSNLVAYGQLHLHDSSTIVDIPSGDTYVIMAPWSDYHGDPSLNIILDPSLGVIKNTIPGIYEINVACSFAADKNNITAFGNVYLDEEEQDHIRFKRRITTVNDIGPASCTGIVDLSVNDVSISFRMKTNYGSSVEITVETANLNIHKIGNTR